MDVRKLSDDIGQPAIVPERDYRAQVRSVGGATWPTVG